VKQCENARVLPARAEQARIVRQSQIGGAPDPLDTALAIARAELSAAEALLEKTRVRAPFAGTILQLSVRVGEVAAPSRERPLMVLGDVSQLRGRVDLDERYREKVFVGQPVLIRSESSVDSFKGKVTKIAPALVLAQATSGGHPERSVVEVLVELAGPTRLMSGMQVDVFFLASPSG
jgi:HlyD family secretion protein